MRRDYHVVVLAIFVDKLFAEFDHRFLMITKLVQASFFYILFAERSCVAERFVCVVRVNMSAYLISYVLLCVYNNTARFQFKWQFVTESANANNLHLHLDIQKERGNAPSFNLYELLPTRVVVCLDERCRSFSLL